MKEAQVFLVNGKIKSGKDSLCEHAKQWLEDQGKSVIILKQATPVKAMIAGAMGIGDHSLLENRSLKNMPCDELGGLTPREAMILVAQGVRNQDTDYWGRLLATKVRQLKHKYDYIFVSDWRFFNEQLVLRNIGEVKYLHSIHIGMCDTRLLNVIGEMIKINKYNLQLELMEATGQDKLSEAAINECHLRAISKVKAIVTDVSETELPSRVKENYFSLVLPNEDGEFHKTCEDFIEYLKQH